MEPRVPSADITHDPRTLRRALNAYQAPRLGRSVLEIIITAVSLVITWTLLWLALSSGYWVGLVLAVPAAGFLVRLFMIQHDCSHGAFFGSRRANDWVGRIIGVIALTPHDFWRHAHIRHHASSGNLDRTSIGDIDTLTIRQFRALSRLQRLRYRLYRHPLILFVVGPAYIFFVDNRLPVRQMRGGWMPWLSTMGTNLGIVVVAGTLMWLVGAGTFLLVHVPIMLLAGSIGIWLFYVQHQFKSTYWEHDREWSFHEAALHGSSHYDLPAVLRWFTANIGVHHVHHLCSRIPYYRLPEVLRDYPELRNVSRLTLGQSFRSVPLVLWDEDSKRLVSFGQARRSYG